uniref:Minor capsid protein P9 transmembrane helices domain-containing protein n=1 Tax=viral metagenome TaxID=1070528 RepID=A0A6C0KNS9_9ZZZZ
MASSSNETYIGKNTGQLKDETFSEDNIITKTIKLDSENTNNTNNANNANANNANVANVANVATNENSIFWLANPSILFSKNHMTELWPTEKMTREQKLNAITRLVILLTLAGFFLSNNYKILVTGIVSIVFLIITYKILNKDANVKLNETFSNQNIYDKVKHNFTNPTSANPIMNILLPEIQDNPHRLEAAPAYNKAVEKAINQETQDFIVTNFNNDETIRKKLFDDRGDKFDFECSMRQFYSTANTRVPNNQNEFARFCYGNMASCKDGDVEMCFRNSDR